MSRDRRTDVVGDTVVDIRIVKKDETLMDARKQENGTSRPNATPRFNQRDKRPLVGQTTGGDRYHIDDAQNLIN